MMKLRAVADALGLYVQMVPLTVDDFMAASRKMER